MRGFEVIARLVQLSPGVKYRLLAGMLMSGLGGIITVVGMGCCGIVVSLVLKNIVSSGELIPWLTGAFLGLTGGYLFRSIAEGMTHEASFQLEVVLRRQLVAVLATLPLGKVQQIGSGGIKKIIQDDVKGLHAAVADATPFVGLGIGQPLAAVVLLAWVQWKLLLIVILMFPIVAVCMMLMTRDHIRLRAQYNRASEEVNAAVIEFVQGMPVVRTFDSGRVAFSRFSRKVEAFSTAVSEWLEVSRRSGIANRILIAPLPTLMILALFSVPLLWFGEITVGELVIALMVGTLPVQAVMPLMYLSNMLNDAKAGAHRIYDILTMTPLSEPELAEYPERYDIQFENVTFGYDDNRQPALKNVNLTIKEGETCALVGASGSGKTTLIRMIPRFYDVSSGTVRIGGTDVRNMDSRKLLQLVSIVFQEPFLFSGSVLDNIRLGNEHASDEEVQAAAKMANAHEFIINELSNGYQTEVGELGCRLSGGQRQRVTIARAILSSAPIVILDEATAFTDPEGEAEIHQGLARLIKGRTVIVIAHRLATITGADKIFVMENGQVVEQGTHENLLMSDGHYTRLWDHYNQACRWGVRNRQEGDNEKAV
ncbi:ABC transporter ATP-binding protein [Salmonella enterica subsp. enterica serovar Newport]|nr:ABC transporter ATP-binding protein [Salmonella enterica subsp. enterica serovar Newport]